MPTIKASTTYRYLPGPSTPIGLEVMFEVYDTTAGGTGGQDFATVITIDPSKATNWSLEAALATGKIDKATGNYMREPAHAYDSAGITASWTERISNAEASATIYFLRGKFDATSGLILVQAESTQLTDPSNSASLDPANVTSLSLPIPAIPPAGT